MACSVMTNTVPLEPVGGTCELDTHADTSVLGRNFIKLQDTMKTVLVSLYDAWYNVVTDLPIVTGATAIQLHLTGETVVLVV